MMYYSPAMIAAMQKQYKPEKPKPPKDLPKIYAPNKPNFQIPWINPNILTPKPPSMPYFRFSTSLFPNSKKIYDECAIPIGIVLRPGDVESPPTLDYTQASEMALCNECGCMLCPQCIVDISRWICPACGASNAFSHGFNAQRPEFMNSVYDVIVPNSANPNKTNCPSFAFVIDTTQRSYGIGLTQQFIYSVKASLDHMPQNANVFILTAGHQLTIFDIVNSREVVMADNVDHVAYNIQPAVLSEYRDSIDHIFDTVLARNSLDSGHCIGDAINYARFLIKSGGLIVASFCGIPTVGKNILKKRQITGEVTEVSLLKLPSDDTSKFFKEMSSKLARSDIALHVFCGGQEYADLPTTALGTGLSAGSCHKYTRLDEEDRMNLHADVFNILTREYMWNAQIRIKLTRGLRVNRVHGNCLTNTSKANGYSSLFGAFSVDDSVVLQIRYEDVQINTQSAFFQVQIWFTTKEGINKRRIFSFSVPLSGSVDAIRDGVDEFAVAGILIRTSTTNVLSEGAGDATLRLKADLHKMLNQNTPLISLPYFVHSLTCSNLLKESHPDGTDGRLALIILLRSININTLMLYLYPRMFGVNDNGEYMILPLTGSSFNINGSCYIVHCWDKIIIWITNAASQMFLNDVFGVSSVSEINTTFPQSGGEIHNRVMSICNECTYLSGKYLPIICIPQGSPGESVFQEILVDDCKGAIMQDFNEFINSYYVTM